jgi:hypothetical protein
VTTPGAGAGAVGNQSGIQAVAKEVLSYRTGSGPGSPSGQPALGWWMRPDATLNRVLKILLPANVSVVS